MKIANLLIAFFLSFPLMSRAAEQQPIENIVSPEEMYKNLMKDDTPINRNHDHGVGMGDPYMDDYYDRVNNSIAIKNSPSELYKNSWDFFDKHKKSLGAGALAVGIGHLLFHYALKKLVNRFFTYLLTKKPSLPVTKGLTSQQIKKSAWINRFTHFTHFVFDLGCAFAGYKTAKWYKLDKPTGERS